MEDESCQSSFEIMSEYDHLVMCKLQIRVSLWICPLVWRRSCILLPGTPQDLQYWLLKFRERLLAADCLIDDELVAVKLPDMILCELAYARGFRQDVQGVDWWLRWFPRGLRVHPPMYRVPARISTTSWEAHIERFRLPSHFRASETHCSLLRLPSEILRVVIHELRASKDGDKIRDTTNLALTCRSLASMTRNEMVQVEAIHNSLLLGDYRRRYCDGCHIIRSVVQEKWRSGNWAVECAGKQWLKASFGDNNIFIDLRSAILNVEADAIVNSVLFGSISNAGRIDALIAACWKEFVQSWLDNRPWRKDSIYLMHGERGSETVRWCPCCRAQKICEDAWVCRTVATIGHNLDWTTQDTSSQTGGNHHGPALRRECLARDVLLKKVHERQMTLWRTRGSERPPGTLNHRMG
jgi:hypothetical protein